MKKNKYGYDVDTELDERMADLHETMTLQEIGNIYGISRQRVQQRINRTGRGFEGYRRVNCAQCGAVYIYGNKTEHKKTHFGNRGRPMTLEESVLRESIVEDYLAGMPMDEMGRKYRAKGTDKPMTYTMLYRHLHRAGITPNRGGGHYVRTPEIKAHMREGQRKRREGLPRIQRSWRPADG